MKFDEVSQALENIKHNFFHTTPTTLLEDPLKVIHFKIWVVSRKFGQFFTNKTCPEGENGLDMTAALFFWKVMIDIKYVFTTVVVEYKCGHTD